MAQIDKSKMNLIRGSKPIDTYAPGISTAWGAAKNVRKAPGAQLNLLNKAKQIVKQGEKKKTRKVLRALTHPVAAGAGGYLFGHATNEILYRGGSRSYIHPGEPALLAAALAYASRKAGRGMVRDNPQKYKTK